VGSSPTLRTKTEPQTLLFDYLVDFEKFLRSKRTKKGYLLADSTVKCKLRIVKSMNRRVNLWDLDAVQRFLDTGEWTEGRKENMAYAYADWCTFKGFLYTPKKYRRSKKLPFVPLEKDIDQLIGGFAYSKYGAFLQLLKETGFRPVEASRIRPMDLDFTRRTVTLNQPAKGSNPRQLRISKKLVSMLTPIIVNKEHNERIWASTSQHISDNFRKKRNKLSQSLGNPIFKQITLRTFRHFKGTQEYARTKDILHVKAVLGHVNIQNTLIYIRLLQEEPDDSFIVRACKDLDEFIESLGNGFEYVSDYQDMKIVRKRK